MSDRPVIGITTYLTTARWSYWELPAALIPASYVSAIVRAGGVPLLVPPASATARTYDAGIRAAGSSHWAHFAVVRYVVMPITGRKLICAYPRS